MSTQPALFGGYEADNLDVDQVRLSADRKRTERQRAAILAGSHPLGLVLGSHLRLHADAPADPFDPASPGSRCGNCHFRVLAEHHNRTWPKCTAGVPDSAVGDTGGVRLDLAPRASHGAATDVRAWWPGCVDHEPDVSSDAAHWTPGGDA